MEDDGDIKLGKRIRELRKADGLTMKELADRMPGVHFTTIGKLETGKMKITFDWIQSLADALGIMPAALVNRRFSIGNIKTVPLFVNSAMEEGELPFSSHPAIGEIPAIVHGPRCYALLVSELDAAAQFRFGHWFMVIDPDQREIKEGGFYALKVGGVDKAAFASFQLSQASLCIWPKADVVPLGAKPFEVLGQVVFQCRSISPSAGEHLHSYEEFAKQYISDFS